MNQRICFNFLILILLVVSCSDQRVFIPTHPTRKASSTISVNEMSTATAPPLINPTLETPSFEPELTPSIANTEIVTESPSPISIMECLETEDENSKGYGLDGSILVKNDSVDYKTVLWNLATNELISLPIESAENSIDFNVSKNGQWLAYLSFRNESIGEEPTPWLVVLSADGKEYKSVRGLGWTGIVRWLDNSRLLIRSGRGNIVPLIVINPFTGETQTLQPNYPEILDFPILREWTTGTETVYNSSLTQVVYPMNNNIVLMDLMDYRLLGQVYPVVINNAVPKWSPEDQEFVYSNATRFSQQPDNVGEFELFIMNRYGEISQRTDFNQLFADTHIPPFYNWSPDGRYIAFYLVYWQSQQSYSSWAVLDTLTNKTIIYCIKPFSGTVSAPIWSPNRYQFLVEAEDSRNVENRLLILIDVDNNIALKITEGKIPLGWMLLP